MNTTDQSDNYYAPPRTFGSAIEVCMSKYATFTGRASRSEYWWFYLFSIACQLIAIVVGAAAADPDLGIGLSVIVGLVFLLPGLAAGARRLHDTNRSGWLQLVYVPMMAFFISENPLLLLIALALLVGAIFFLAQESKPEKNAYDK